MAQLAVSRALWALLSICCGVAAGEEYALRLRPAPALEHQLYRNTSLSSWGGNVVKGDPDDPHAYHLFAAAFTNGCGLSGWQSNSVVVHAVADSPTGPFAYHDTALPPWHHCPQMIRAPDGTWLIYSMGRTNASSALPCKDHSPVGPARKQQLRVEVHYSPSLYGPWTLLRPSPDTYDGAIGAFNGNPAPIFLPNGSVVVVGTGFGDSLAVAVADDWRGPYRPWMGCRGLPEPKPDNKGANVTRDGCMPFVGRGNYEDPVVWWDARAQRFKLLMHQYAGGLPVGGYAESETEDFFGGWRYDSAVAGYNTSVALEDGTGIVLQRRERPKVFLEGGVAKYLYNGVCHTDNNADCFTFVQEIAT